MRQILQNLRTGETDLAEVPAPATASGHVLIRSKVSLVSAGTERMLVQFGKATLFQKARSQPERVRQVFDKIRTDGLLPTIEAVFRKLDEPLPLGYSNAGEVIEVGEGVREFAIGDRVASNGPHAELVAVPANLVAKIPENVSDEAAAFTVIGAIGLQGIRLAQPELGETFVVIGLGLIGQITAQLLRAAGCKVVGLDFDEAKVTFARSAGILALNSGGESDPVKQVLAATSGLGADGVIITASTTSNDVISQSARMSRKRGRIVLIGVVGLNINRADFYEKELTFQVSCSYGPGRYDDAYEEKGRDYPLGYVRWTENRNFQAVLAALSSGALNVTPMITQRAAFSDFGAIYGNMDSGGLASLLIYSDAAPARATLTLSEFAFAASDRALALVGAGNFSKMVVMPALAAAKAPVKAIVSANGVTGTGLARKYRVPISSTDFDGVIADPQVGGVVITTRHDLHASMAARALRGGKHVLVEKPLCLDARELRELEVLVAALPAGGPTLSVGYNRRFSTHTGKIRLLLGERPGPLAFVATINAGEIPVNSWVHDPRVGGGRLLGEACHFVDLAIFVTGSLIVEVSAAGLDGNSAPTNDTASILLRHANGSTSVVNYFANGHRTVSKERIEVHSQGRTLLLDNFRELRGYGFRSFETLKTRQDKGHDREFALFAERLRLGGPALIPWPEIVNSTRATMAALRSLTTRQWVGVDEI